MFTNEGADRFLRAATGQLVPAASLSGIRVKLHTEQEPSLANELVGHGYSDVFVDPSTVQYDDLAGFRRLRFPGLEWFTAAGVQAQIANSVGFWHGNTLQWSDVQQIIPGGARVFSNAGDGVIGVEMSDASLTLTPTAIDRGMRAVAGEGFVPVNMGWRLHFGTGVPDELNKIIGGGITGAPVTTWTFTTIGPWRRISQAAIVFSSGLSADTNEEPTQLALWRNDGGNEETLFAYRSITSTGNTAINTSVLIPANQMFIELDLVGA